MHRLAGFVLALAAVAGPWWSRADAWFITVDGFPNVFDESGAATEVVLDPAGHVIAGGYLADAMPFARGFSTFFTKRDGATGRELWRTLLGPGLLSDINIVPPVGVTLDAQGDVLAGGRFRRAVDNVLALGAVKLDGDTGSVAWLTTIAPPGAAAGAARAGDDLVVAGSVDTEPNPALFDHDFAVVRFAGADGAVLWQTVLNGVDSPSDADGRALDVARGVAVDPAGDVFAVGAIETTAPPDVITVVKLDGATGAAAWPAPVFLGSGFGAFVAAMPSGDAVVAGSRANVGTVVTRVSGADGSVVWTTILSPHGTPRALALDAASDVVVAGGFGTLHVSKLDGGSGAVSWSTVVPGEPSFSNDVGGMVIDATGEVVVSGTLDTPSTGVGVVVLRLDGTTGALVRRHLLSGSRFGSDDPTDDDAGGLALGPGGRVAVAAAVVTATRDDPHRDFAVLQFSPRLTGKTLIVRQGVKNVLTMRSRDPNLFAVAPGGAGDPTIDGAVLEVRNPASGETATVPLPAASWRSIDGPRPDVQTYRYSDRLLAHGPCKAVTVKSGRVIKVKCTGPLPGLSLDEPSQGTLAVRLALGTGAGSYCAAFAADVDLPGYFKGQPSPPPAACD